MTFIIDDKLKSSDDLTRYGGVPTLAVVPMLDVKPAPHKRVKAPRK